MKHGYAYMVFFHDQKDVLYGVCYKRKNEQLSRQNWVMIIRE